MNDTAWIARVVIVLGVAAVVFGLLILALSRFGIKGHPLPGDILIRWGNTTIYIPIVTGIIISIILTLLFRALAALKR